MHNLLLSALLTFSPIAYANKTCITGDPTDQRLVKIFYDTKNPDNAPIARWRREKSRFKLPIVEVPVCRDCKQPFLMAISELAGGLQGSRNSDSKMDNNCVASAMASAETGVMKTSTYPPAVKLVGGAGKSKPVEVALPPPHEDCELKGTKYKCATQSFICAGAKSEPETKAGGTPCITSDMAEYLTWITNQAMKCLSREDDPIDRRTIFKKLNNESQFLFAVKNKNGMCTQQLIDVAIREMLAPSRGYGEIIEPINRLLQEKKPKDPARQAACRAFTEVLDKKNTPPNEIGSGRHALKHCDFLQPGIGIARCALLGIGYFAHVSYTYKTARDGVMKNISADAVVRRSGLEPTKDEPARDLRDYIALAAYSSAGPGGASIVFEETARAMRCPGAKCTSSALFTAFKTNMMAYYDRDGRKLKPGQAAPKKVDTRQGRDKLPNYYEAIAARLTSLYKKMDGIQGTKKVQYSEQELRGDRCVR